MSDELERRGRRAGAAVHARTGRLAPDRDLDRVLRRGSRPRTGPIVAVALVAVLAVPVVIWLTPGREQTVQFGDEPPTATPEPEGTPTPPVTEPADPEPGPELDPHDPSPALEATPEPDEEPPAGPQALGEFGTGEVVTDNFPFAGTEIGLLTDVRVAGQSGFDRIVLEFRGEEMPGYRVTYVDPPILQDGSGEEIGVAGNAFLSVHLAPASGVDLAGEPGEEGYEMTYEGPFRITANTGVVTEFVRVGDFEANLSWVVGLREQAPFAVTVLHDPLRLVIDIQVR